MAKKKADRNYLDNVPVRNPEYVWSEHAETGIVTVTVPHSGVFDRIAQRFFHRPAHSLIDLDVYGSFVWKRIDGAASVYEISEAVSAQFGADAEPLYNRLLAFFGILITHKFITLRAKS